MLFKEFKKSLEANNNVIIRVNTWKTMYTLLPRIYLGKDYRRMTAEEALEEFGNREVDYIDSEMVDDNDSSVTVYYLNKKVESWLTFVPMIYTGVTKKFKVVSKSDKSILGVVKWHTGYRAYAFYVTSIVYMERNPLSGIDRPKADSKVFDNDCMREVTLFMEQQMMLYKLEKEVRDNG